MRGLAVDPGASYGWAVYEDGALLDCGAGRPGDRTWAGIDHVVAEKPQRYPHDPISPTKLETLREHLRVVLRPLIAAGVPVVYVFPREWKGQLPKPTHARRIVAKLRPEERAVYDARMRPLGTKARTDLTDACGLGQWALMMKLWR